MKACVRCVLLAVLLLPATPNVFTWDGAADGENWFDTEYIDGSDPPIYRSN